MVTAAASTLHRRLSVVALQSSNTAHLGHGWMDWTKHNILLDQVLSGTHTAFQRTRERSTDTEASQHRCLRRRQSGPLSEPDSYAWVIGSTCEPARCRVDRCATEMELSGTTLFMNPKCGEAETGSIRLFSADEFFVPDRFRHSGVSVSQNCI